MSKHSVSVIILLCAFFFAGCSGTERTILPGRLPDGRIRLPNGWMLSPAGKHVEVGELPLNMEVSPNGRYVIVTNNGTGEQSLSVIDVQSWTMTQSVPIPKSWLGLRFIDGGNRFLVSGGNDNLVRVYDFQEGKATIADSILLGSPLPAQKIWAAGLDVDENYGRLFAVGKESDSMYVVDLKMKTVIKRIQLPAKPYTCLTSRSKSLLFVSLWGGSSVAVFDVKSCELLRTIHVGDHPNDMAESPDGKRLFVANANHNTVSVIDIELGKVEETITTALFPKAPSGSTPNSVALNGDGTRLYIANADNNYVNVVDISKEHQSRSLGFIPVGWYPTCVRVLPKTQQLIVANGKGGASKANPHGPNPEKPSPKEEYIGRLFKGSVSLIDVPTPADLENHTTNVYANSPYTDTKKDRPGTDRDNPVPYKVGGRSPIKHVFYIIKENRTYDQVFGDLDVGNGDSTLCIFPERITPNHHALAKQFVLLDNFYADAEVSADGHNWSMGAYATDYVEKTWPTVYGGRGGEYEYEGGTAIVYPSAGYIWDNCKRNNVSYRSYGEFVENGATPDSPVTARTPALEGHIAPFYRGWDLSYSDVQRATDWMGEFHAYEREGVLPQFQIIKLPNDHTEGTKRGSPTPRAYVAQNDLALGLIVETISHSKFWNESAIFVIEDDAQNGSDHVDAHRTVALVISPYTKHGFVDSELYSTSSMVRTMELILGLPPLSQFDAAATPMYNSFTSTPDRTPYDHRESNVDLDETNIAGAYGQEHTTEMDFSREDAIPDIEFNEIIWKSVRGAASEMPAPVRSAFVRVAD